MLRPLARLAPALAAALVLAAGSPAPADPFGGRTPLSRDLVGVGAQVTDQLFNRLSTDYEAALTAAGDPNSPRLYSWDATGSSPVTPKLGAYAITRPNGTAMGLLALNGYHSDTVDFVRTTRGPRAGDPPTTYFVPLARDAVTWAAPAGADAPADLTPAQLRAIYTCRSTTWDRLDPALPATPIRPALPDLGSETRTQFLDAIGVGVLGGCVTTVGAENQGLDPLLVDPGAVVPYSIGHYLGQVYGGHTSLTDDPGPLVPRAINGNPAVDPATHTIGSWFAGSAFGHPVGVAVRESDWVGTDTHGVALRAVFGRTGWICQGSGAADLQSYGFLRFPAAVCGTPTHS
ncbi:substrate-binding domain-containing protein [Kitasatospora purpeofusca]|uniref:substrate-binding domain-containing protein n=1 Tax=Kitasatospora purpeofusca TaxID=67352 RepID=UPI0036D3864F